MRARAFVECVCLTDAFLLWDPCVFVCACRVGCPNTNGEVLSKDDQDEYEELLQAHDCVPVFLLPGLADKFFNSFCKGVLWPMLHVSGHTT